MTVFFIFSGRHQVLSGISRRLEEFCLTHRHLRRFGLDLPSGMVSVIVPSKNCVPMLQDTISKIEGRIQTSSALGDETRAELLKLLGQLKTEVTELSKTHLEEAESIASLAELSAREATRASKNPQVLNHAIGGLKSSVRGFEGSHARLAGVVNRIATMLANMGI
jgi:DNA-binding transcriptional ArsR family regulator